jgi:hypothetical protein
MPGRKVFVANDILTAADVNEFLANQAVMVFADATARTTAIPSPLRGMVTYLQNSDALFSYNGTAWVRAVNVASISSGPIIQVLQTVKTDPFSTTSNSYVGVTGFSATITPRATTSKVLVLMTTQGATTTGTTSSVGGLRIMRGATSLPVGGADTGRSQVASTISTRSTSNLISIGQSVAFVDSPNTASAVTYSVEAFVIAGTLFLNRIEFDTAGNNTSMRSVSTLTLMEVAGA